MTDNNIGWPAARELLAQHGYKVLVRVDGWVEMLVCCPGERWEGKGADEGEALEDVLARMLPSRLARKMLPESHTTYGGPPQPFVESHVPPAGSGEAAAVSDPGPVDEPMPSADADTNSSTPAVPLTNAVTDEERDDVPPATVDPEEGGAPAMTEPVEIEAFATPRTPLTTDEALEALEPIEDRVEAEGPELGLLAPERQRLVILAWFCRARAIEDASEHAPAVVRRVAAMAKHLTALCKVYWPGSVAALQMNTIPRRACRDLHLAPDAPRPATWEEVAVLAEDALHRQVDRDTADKRDEYGWADTFAQNPAPFDPEAELARLCSEVEQLTGPVNVPPPRSCPAVLRSPGRKEAILFMNWAHLARWLRTAVADFDTWSMVVGRLRWMAARLEGKVDGFEAALDPSFQPPLNWAVVLKRDPVKERHAHDRQALMARRETLDVTDERATQEWLGDALALLDKDEIAHAVRPFKDMVLAIHPETFTEKRTRRARLRDVQAMLLQDQPTGTASDMSQVGKTDAGPDGITEETPAPDYLAEVFTRVRPHTEGRAAAFVSNRNDPELQSMLRDAMGFREVDWCEGTPRRVRSIEERIGQGAFDFVLAATGFQSHSVDGALYRACKKAGIPYIRVNKGRPVACAAAIARQIGMPVA